MNPPPPPIPPNKVVLSSTERIFVEKGCAKVREGPNCRVDGYTGYISPFVNLVGATAHFFYIGKAVPWRTTNQKYLYNDTF